jgi:predicted transcriptional regulator
MSSISQVTERRGLFVVRKETVRRDLEGTAIVSRTELRRLADPQELHDLIEERRRQAKPPE